MICGSIARSFGNNSSRRTAFDDRRRDRRAVDVRKRLGGEDDGRILLAKRLQPLAKPAGEILVVERKPTFIDDEQGRPAVEAVPQSDETDRPARPAPTRGSDQSFGFEDLD